MTLSVILFILGLVAIVGVYVYYRNKKADSFPPLTKAQDLGDSDGGPGEEKK